MCIYLSSPFASLRNTLGIFPSDHDELVQHHLAPNSREVPSIFSILAQAAQVEDDPSQPRELPRPIPIFALILHGSVPFAKCSIPVVCSSRFKSLRNT